MSSCLHIYSGLTASLTSLGRGSILQLLDNIVNQRETRASTACGSLYLLHYFFTYPPYDILAWHSPKCWRLEFGLHISQRQIFLFSSTTTNRKFHEISFTSLSVPLSDLESYSTRLALPAIIQTNDSFRYSFSHKRQNPLREPARAKCSVLGNDIFVSFFVNLSFPMRLFIDILLNLFTNVLSLSYSCRVWTR